MKLSQLRYFLAVADELHFTRAAEKLHIAQPGLSLQIRQLENELGTQLFRRLKHQVKLTPAGRVFAQRIRIVLKLTEKAATEASLLGRGQAGTLTIGFISAAVISILPQLLHNFHAEVPTATIELLELEPKEQINGLREGTIDLGLFGVMDAFTDRPGFEFVTLRREQLIAALPKRYATSGSRRIDLKALAAETFLLPKTHEFGGLHEVVMGACRSAGFLPRKIQGTRMLLSALCLAARGLGVALVPESFRESVQIDGLVYRRLSKPLAIEIGAVWLKRNDSLLLERFRRCFPDFPLHHR